MGSILVCSLLKRVIVHGYILKALISPVKKKKIFSALFPKLIN